MIWRTALHYVRFWLVLGLASGQFTSDQMSQIVDLHNQYRSTVTPQAANMQRMIWNKQLSQVASAYASQCRWEHNSKIIGVLGENLFMTTGPFIISQPIDLWFAESVNYNLNSGTCAAGKECGHYTQMVWAGTNLIGCAAQFCETVVNSNSQNVTLFACNYYPPGNIIGQSPYKEGPSCSSCPTVSLGCLNNACDLGTNLTLALPANVTASLINPTTEAGSSAGFLKPSAASLLLAGLTALYIRTT